MSTTTLSLSHGTHAGLTRPRLRLTRRGRVVVFTAALLFVLACGMLFTSSSTATDEGGAEPRTERIVVGSGETLWDVAAERTEGDQDVRELMATIKEINDLDSSMLMAGQELFIPVD